MPQRRITSTKVRLLSHVIFVLALNILLINFLAGLDAVEKKFGQGKINPEQSRGVNEKVTDGIRGLGEKITGFVLASFCAPDLSPIFLDSHGVKQAYLLTLDMLNSKKAPEKFSN